jgi:hypothetical protein
MDMRALIFMPALAGAVIFGFVFLLFMCNYYLTVIEATGAGAKEIPWVSEPLFDNAWKFWYLGWLIGIWLGPAFFIGRAATAGHASPWLTLAIPLLVLWLCYPISQLSSLSATSMWFPLVPDVFTRLAQKPGVVLGFFALSAGVMALLGVAFRCTFMLEGQWELLFVGAPLLVLSALLYARLLGRLAFALRFTKGLFPTKKKKEPKEEILKQPEEETKPAQPDELPAISTPEGELVGYNILMTDEPPARPKKRVKAELAEPESEDSSTAADVPKPSPQPRPRRKPEPESSVERSRVWTDEDDDAATPYGVRDAEVQPAEASATEVVKPSESEMKLLRRDDVPKKPKQVWGPELLVFLGQAGTVSAVVIASGLCFMMGVMIRVARAYNPVGSGE